MGQAGGEDEVQFEFEGRNAMEEDGLLMETMKILGEEE